jgi:hypothetical protein
MALAAREGDNMRQIILALLSCLPAAVLAAGPAPEGRWEGQIRIPGRELQAVVDLAPSGGTWIGSITMPGLDMKGAPLANITATGSEVTFEIAVVLDASGYGPARFKAHLDAGDAMSGEMAQAGNTAAFSLHRVGAAQVDAAQRSTPVGTALADKWIGEFELGGYPRHVTLTLENHAQATATATLVVVGKQTTNIPIDLVVEDGRFLRIESQATRVTFEGSFVEGSDEIDGMFELGAFELPLILHRAAGRAS